MLRKTLVAAGCAAVLVGSVPGPAAARAVRAAAAPCPDARVALQAFDASRMWTVAGTKGGGVTIGVVGAPDRVAEVVCAIKALAPDAAVAAGEASGAIVVVADTSVDPGGVGGPALVVAAAGDTGGEMTGRPQGVVNVAAAGESGARLSSSAYGPALTVAAYGNDTSTAAGYVAALAAVLRAGHASWPARQVVAQEAGSINPYSGSQHTNDLGFGVINPVQAVSLPAVDPETLPGFGAMFPVNQPPRSTSPSARSQSPSQSQPSSAGTGATSAGSAAPPTDSASASGSSATAAPSSGATDSANVWPTAPLSSAGSSNLAHTAGGKGGGSGGVSPVLFIGLLALVGGGGWVLWQRRFRSRPAPAKPPSEWEAPSGPRHSGYSPPDE
ncbi:MAG: hypothetical protein ACJ786_25240 [Catenulispora sp.]